jgi:hypothetical protein
MKRSMGGGAHRGPVGASRQRRTIRFVQLLLVLISGGLMMFAGYSYGQARGFDEGRRADEVGAPSRPGIAQTVVLVALGGLTIGAALMLEGGGGTVRLPTPRRLEEFAKRAEDTAIRRAEEVAAEPAEPRESDATSSLPPT